MLRKAILNASQPFRHPPISQESISIADDTLVSVSSEMPAQPIDCICDGHSGPGSTRWIADEPGDQSVVFSFDTPHTLHRVSVEVEELDVSRTQELALSISVDGGQTYREILRQEYNFSPPGTTFEHEQWQVPAEGVTNVWMWIRPDKGGKPCRASMTSFALE